VAREQARQEQAQEQARQAQEQARQRHMEHADYYNKKIAELLSASNSLVMSVPSVKT
jgi:hypothetical protein